MTPVRDQLLFVADAKRMILKHLASAVTGELLCRNEEW